jgi:hypothetical protein
MATTSPASFCAPATDQGFTSCSWLVLGSVSAMIEVCDVVDSVTGFGCGGDLESGSWTMVGFSNLGCTPP